MTHVLDDARGQMREGHTSAQWEWIAREKVAQTLLETGEFTADDLADLNIPVQYRGHVHGAATGYWSGDQECMEFVERRKSSRPSRKGAKNDVFHINAKGRRELPKLLRDLQLELSKLVGLSSGSSGEVGAAAQSDKKENVGLTTAAGEPGRISRSGRSGQSGGLTSAPSHSPCREDADPSDTTTGPSTGGNDQEGALPITPSVAGGGEPSLVQLERPKGSSMYSAWEDGEAA